jgi:hypothetical protein
MPQSFYARRAVARADAAEKAHITDEIGEIERQIKQQQHQIGKR